MDEKFIIANRTDTGCQRPVNEDYMVTFDSPNGRVVAVCDGMGGQAAGDVASRLACDIISDILSTNTFASPNEAITRSMMAANRGILHRAATNPELESMGATCVIAIIKNGNIYYGWVGDSRIYFYSDGVLRQISRDQSYVQSLVESGQLTPEEAEHHPRKNEIVNALGLENMTPPELGAIPIKATPGSMLMMCSDGLSGMVPNSEIQAILADKTLTPQQKVDRLVNRANENGGVDNITGQLVSFPGSSKSTAAVARRKSGMLVWAATGALVVILVVAAFFMFRPAEIPDETVEDTPVKSVDTRTPAKRTIEIQNNTSTTSTTTRTVNETSRKQNSQKDKASRTKAKPKANTQKIINKTEKKETTTEDKIRQVQNKKENNNNNNNIENLKKERDGD